MSLTGKTIVVTGATGFLGSHITRALLDAGANVRGAVRTPSNGQWLVDLGATMIAADLGDRESLAKAFEGADAVVSNAALATRKGSTWDDFVNANQLGAENVAHAAGDAGVKRLVHVSTVAVYNPRIRHVNSEADTRSILEPSRFAWNDLTTDWRYSKSKALGERRVWELASQLGIETTAIRPGPIYGSRDGGLTEKYAKAMRSSIRLAVTLRAPHVHAGDVAIAIRGALLNDASIGQSYNVTGTRVSPYEVLRTWKQITGAGPTLIPIPVPLWIDFDDSAAKRDLGFSCRGIEAGVREIVAAG